MRRSTVVRGGMGGTAATRRLRTSARTLCAAALGCLTSAACRSAPAPEPVPAPPPTAVPVTIAPAICNMTVEANP